MGSFSFHLGSEREAGQTRSMKTVPSLETPGHKSRRKVRRTDCVFNLLSFKDNSKTNKIKYFSFSVLKASKPMMEKRRRERINSSLETLRLLMLENTRNEVRDLFQLYLSFNVGKPRGVLYGVQSFGSFGRLVPATKQKSSSTTSFASSRQLI